MEAAARRTRFFTDASLRGVAFRRNDAAFSLRRAASASIRRHRETTAAVLELRRKKMRFLPVRFFYSHSALWERQGNQRLRAGLANRSSTKKSGLSVCARYSARCVNISRNSHIQMLTNCTCSFLREKAPGLARWVRLRKRVCSSVVVCKLYMGQYGEIVRRLLRNHRSDNLAIEQVNAPILNNHWIRHISDFEPISSKDSSVRH